MYDHNVVCIPLSGGPSANLWKSAVVLCRRRRDAVRRVIEFFTANIRNPNTRGLCLRRGPLRRGCDGRGIARAQLTSVIAAGYISEERFRSPLPPRPALASGHRAAPRSVVRSGAAGGPPWAGVADVQLGGEDRRTRAIGNRCNRCEVSLRRLAPRSYLFRELLEP
jgi:hypothetical protein